MRAIRTTLRRTSPGGPGAPSHAQVGAVSFFHRRHGLLDEADAHDMLTWQGSGGFSVDASVRIDREDRSGIERLVRYCARPPSGRPPALPCLPADEDRRITFAFSFAEERVAEVPDHHLQLANLYRDTGRPKRALEEVEHVLALPAVSPMELAVRNEALALKETLTR